MGVEPPPGTGASAGTDAHTHHRICTCHLAAERADCHASSLISARDWIWFTHHGHLLEDGSLLGARLSSPARWDAPLSSRKASSPPGAASRGRFFFQAEDGIRDFHVTGVQTCALPISLGRSRFSKSVGSGTWVTSKPGPSSRNTNTARAGVMSM